MDPKIGNYPVYYNEKLHVAVAAWPTSILTIKFRYIVAEIVSQWRYPGTKNWIVDGVADARLVYSCIAVYVCLRLSKA